MSLRVRLLLAFAGIALVLLAADALLALTVQRSLTEQVDRRLGAALSPLTRSSYGSGSGRGSRSANNTGAMCTSTNPADNNEASPSGTLTEIFIERRDPDGGIIYQICPGLRDEAPPKLVQSQLDDQARLRIDPPEYFTIGSVSSSGPHYRMSVVRMDDGDLLVVGISLKDTEATFKHVLWVMVGSTGVVLVVLAVVAWWVLRLGLRPIAAMAATAHAIAVGDLSRRVDTYSESTEVGQLGLALNGMLHQIEGAFAQQQTSEDRLRRFVADASHELRTPLTSIRGYTELYRTGIISEGSELSDAMRRIEAESSRMQALVDDLLLLARLDQRRPVSWEPVNLSDLAADAVADARAVEPDRPLALELPDTPVVVLGEEQRLGQVIGNLLANARTHTPEGTPVTVRLTAQDGRALVEVIDEGPGVDPAIAEKVFERFYRADPARARNAGGTGLGLSIVAAVAQSHHGTAWLAAGDGPPGRPGVRFCVDLPLATPLPPPDLTDATPTGQVRRG